MSDEPFYLRVSLEWKPQDLWVGAYWESEPAGGCTTTTNIWICLLPMVPIHILYSRPDKEKTMTDGEAYLLFCALGAIWIIVHLICAVRLTRGGERLINDLGNDDLVPEYDPARGYWVVRR